MIRAWLAALAIWREEHPGFMALCYNALWAAFVMTLLGGAVYLGAQMGPQ